MGRPKKENKKQISLYVPEEKMPSLEADAKDLGFASVPAMFDEVVKLYFDYWKGERRRYLTQAELMDGSKKDEASPKIVGMKKPKAS
jgi:hypothetical protein